MATGQDRSGTAPSSWLEGWPLLATLTLVLCLTTLVALKAAEGSDGIRLAIRVTARTSLVLFLLAFTASACARACANPWTRWQLRNRRQLGLSFAVSHLLHALALAALAVSDPRLFADIGGSGMLLAGGSAYLVIAAMAATSFDRTAKLIGAVAWRRLHLFGVWYIWLSFVVAFGKRAVLDVFYWPFIAALLGALMLRLAFGGVRRFLPETPR
jgi:DMSO/TMAO reductase YedYZ heme-binding membrane subunit